MLEVSLEEWFFEVFCYTCCWDVLFMLLQQFSNTDKRLTPLGQCVIHLPNRDVCDRNPNPILHDVEHTYFWEWGFVAASLPVSTNPIKYFAREHPSRLDDDDFAILVLHQIFVSEVIQPLRVMAHAVLWSASAA